MGDGLIIATPTGSTAYNMTAFGSIVQGNTQCILLTPIASDTLNFRPLILPVPTVIGIRKHEDTTSPVWVSLDGDIRFELLAEEELIIEASTKSMALVTQKDENLIESWSKRLKEELGWNDR